LVVTPSSTSCAITHWTMYCTGIWSFETQQRHAREAPMIRP